MYMGGKVELYWGDTKIVADAIEVTYNTDSSPVEGLDGTVYNYATSAEIEIKGLVRSIGDSMYTSGCEDRADQAARYREAAQGEDRIELRKAGLMRADGSLSQEGRNLLLEILFDSNKDKLVEAAKKLNEKE